MASVALGLGCSGSSGPADAGGMVDSGPLDAGADAGGCWLDAGPLLSSCGFPCDLGNELGIGRFCDPALNIGCPNTAPICSAKVNNDPKHPSPSDTYFCLNICDECSPPDACGSNAACVCTSQGCGCAPTSCGGVPDGGNPPCLKDAGP